MIITPTNITVIEAVTTNKFQLDFINDNPKEKKVIAQIYPLDLVDETVIQGQVRFLTLWEGQEYDNVGNWTQQQANDRIIELLID